MGHILQEDGIVDIVIRPYADADFDTVTAIWLSSWQSTGVPSNTTLEELRERWPQELAKGWTVHVATVGAEIVGFIGLKDDTLEQLFVATNHQGRGIGKKLLDFVKHRMPSGFHLTTPVESRAGRFYQREGLESGERGIHPRWGHVSIRYDWRPKGRSRER
jgi:GNAT superfamily N-acetyltransferase